MSEINRLIAEARGELIDERVADHKDIPLNYTYYRGKRYLWTPDYECDLNWAWSLLDEIELPYSFSVNRNIVNRLYVVAIFDERISESVITTRSQSLEYSICEAWLQWNNIPLPIPTPSPPTKS